MKKIKLSVIDDNRQHFFVTFERPGRVEISVVNGNIIAHVYDGSEIDQEQDPLGGYDATLPVGFADGNNSWEG